jgi:RHS repeat-associated protein
LVAEIVCAHTIITDRGAAPGGASTGNITADNENGAVTGLAYNHANRLKQASLNGTPTIPASGSYDVYARWVAASANAGAADYVVTHAGGTSTVSVNQKQNGGQWVKLGTYSFTPSAGHKVELLGSYDGRVIADSIRLVAAGAGASNLVYIHADHLGSPQKMTDAAQTLVWDAQFDPFGEEVGIAGPATHPTRFPGQYADPETGFSYNYFRDYDPTIGRYVQSDPIGLRGGINTYLYVRANPLNRIDPTGQATSKVIQEAWKRVAPYVIPIVIKLLLPEIPNAFCPIDPGWRPFPVPPPLLPGGDQSPTGNTGAGGGGTLPGGSTGTLPGNTGGGTGTGTSPGAIAGTDTPIVDTNDQSDEWVWPLVMTKGGGSCSCQHRDVFISGGVSCQILRENGICSGPYTGTGPDRASCQSDARNNAPEACRGCLGHCIFRPGS